MCVARPQWVKVTGIITAGMQGCLTRVLPRLYTMCFWFDDDNLDTLLKYITSSNIILRMYWNSDITHSNNFNLSKNCASFCDQVYQCMYIKYNKLSVYHFWTIIQYLIFFQSNISIVLYAVKTCYSIRPTWFECHVVWNNQQLCLVKSLYTLTAKKTPMTPITGPLWGESIGHHHSQRASNMDTIPTSWHHHGL